MMIDEEKTGAKEAGKALAQARWGKAGLQDLPGGLPADEDGAYAVQREAVRAYGERRVGWKIGATSPEAQAMLKTDHPLRAPLFATDCYDDGAIIDEPAHGLVGLEPEFALRLGRDLPVRDQPWTPDDVRSAVAAVHPAIEIVGLRLPDGLFKNVLVVTADFGANVGFVTGEGIKDWQGHDMAEVPVRAMIEGREVASGSGAKVLGHPLNALLWLVNHLARSGEGLCAGDWISTGTCAGIVPIARGQTVKADFGPFGAVSLTLAA